MAVDQNNVVHIVFQDNRVNDTCAKRHVMIRQISGVWTIQAGAAFPNSINSGLAGTAWPAGVNCHSAQVAVNSRNEVHFLLGTRGDASSEGYFFEPWEGGQLATVLWDKVDAVLVLRMGDAEWVEQWSIHKGDALVAALPGHGFHESARLTTMSLWRRTP